MSRRLSLKDKMKEGKKSRFFYGYIIVGAAFLIIAVARGGLNTFGVFFQPVMDEFGWTRAMTSGAFSLHMGLAGILAIGAGAVNDRFGPRLVLTLTGVLLGVGYVLMSRISEIWQFYAIYGVIMGIGLTGNFSPILSTVTRWFAKRRGMMAGIALCGVGVGTVIMPLAAGWLVRNYDWRISFLVFGAACLFLIILPAQFLKRDPQSIGQLPDGAPVLTKESLTLPDSGFTFREAIKTKRFWMLGFSFLSIGYAIFTISVHIVIHATGLGLSTSRAVAIVSVLGAFNIAGRLIMGFVSDKFGSRAAMMIGLVPMIIALFWLLFAKDMWSLYLFAALFGLAWGGTLVLSSPMIAEFFGLKAMGTLLGLINALITVGGTLGPFVAGYIFDLTGSYQIAFTICILLNVTGLVSAWLGKSKINPLPQSSSSATLRQ